MALLVVVFAGTLAAGPRGIAHAQSNGETVSVGEVEIAYELSGPPNGETVVLIPGTGQQLIDWPPALIEELTEVGFNVLRFDHRDTGRSSVLDEAGVPDPAAIEAAMQAGEPAPVPYDFHDMAGDVVGLLDALDIAEAHVVGMSMGGAIAQLIAIDYPERVASLTLFAADSGNPELPAIADPEAFADVPSQPPSNRDAYVDYRLAVSEALAGSGYPMEDAARRDAAERSLERFFDIDAITRQEIVSFVGHLSSAQYRLGNLERIEAPTVVLHGAEDPLVPVESANDIAERVADAQLRIMPGLGHELPPGAAEALAEAIVAAAARAADDSRRRP